MIHIVHSICRTLYHSVVCLVSALLLKKQFTSVAGLNSVAVVYNHSDYTPFVLCISAYHQLHCRVMLVTVPCIVELVDFDLIEDARSC